MTQNSCCTRADIFSTSLPAAPGPKGIRSKLQAIATLCGLLALQAIAPPAARATVVWEDYRGNANAGSIYTGPVGKPTFGNYSGNPITNLRAIASNPASAVRTGSSANIDFRQSEFNLCHPAAAPNSASCQVQAMGRVTYALIRLPAAGTYALSVAHDDNIDVDVSSDYANTSYRNASYDVPIGTVGDYTSGETVFSNLGTFTAAAANSCALLRVYWTNAGGINFSRLRWTRPDATTEIIPAVQLFDPGLAASANGCNGSITGNRTAVTLNKVLASPRAQAADQFTVEIATAAAAGTVRQATTSGSSIGQQVSTGAFAAVTGSTYYLRELMAAGSASTLGAYSATITCTRNGVTFTPAGVAPTWSVTPAANDQIICAITNSARPVLRLQKALPDGRAQSSDQFTLGIAGAGAGSPAVVTTSGTGNAPAQAAVVNPATVAGSYVLSETGAGGTNLANYVTSYACTNAMEGGQTPSGSGTSFNLTAVAGDNLTCTFSNRATVTSLAISKSNTLGAVTAGGTTTYAVVVRNSGPAAASNAVVRDDWTNMPGLDCSAGTVTCVASGAAGTQCPAAASVTPAALLAGLPIPLIPNNGVITLTLQCRVTASGQ